MGKLTVLQINADRSLRAHDMAYHTALQEKADLIVASEPNKKHVKPPSKWISDVKQDIAIYSMNRNVKARTTIKRTGIVGLEMEEMTIFGCYFSPNITIRAYEDCLSSLQDLVKSAGKETLVLGDFNAKAVEWGSPATDGRGQMLLELAVMLGLEVQNRGKEPTFVRRASCSHIDVTFASPTLGRRIHFWKILETESFSPHKHILFAVDAKIKPMNTLKGKVSLDKKQFKKILLEGEQTSKNDNNLDYRLKQAFLGSRKHLKEQNRHSVPYWWNNNIEELRDRCIAQRRCATRSRLRREADRVMQDKWNSYKAAKKLLGDTIKAEKRKLWKEMCDELNEDIWGQGYQHVMRRIKRSDTPFELTTDKKTAAVEILFPERFETLPARLLGTSPVDFTIEDITDGCQKMKSGKAPGPDGIPAEAIKEAVEVIPGTILKFLNNALQKQVFPDKWKLSKLVLIHKTGKPIDVPNAYRPLCLENTLAKLYEHLIKKRLETELENSGGLAPNQYGFIKGKSTMDAVRRVLEAGRTVKCGGGVQGDRWCVLIALDVKNAFNSASWLEILKQLQERKTSPYLFNIIRDYFSNRAITYDKVIKTTSAGIPQGSVIGPLLWNVFYDPVLKLEYPKDVEAVGFADDLAVIIQAENTYDLISKSNRALILIDGWMKSKGLELAAEKTELLVLSGKRDRSRIVVKIDRQEIKPVKQLKYLGICIGQDGYLGPHVQMVTTKAEERLSALSKVMQNINGPSSEKRLLLYGVVQSIVLYGAHVWGGVIAIQKYGKMLERLQRRALLRVVSGYRTVSTEAVQVLAGIPPISLIIQERKKTIDKPDNHTRSLERQTTIQTWQTDWDNNTTKGQWTKTLIKDLKTWIECRHRTMDYFLAQALSGHGSFKAYTFKLGKTDNRCLYCNEVDTAEHTLFDCVKWDEYRTEASRKLGTVITKENMIGLMLRDSATWSTIHATLKNIMQDKEKDELLQQQDND